MEKLSLSILAFKFVLCSIFVSNLNEYISFLTFVSYSTIHHGIISLKHVDSPSIFISKFSKVAQFLSAYTTRNLHFKIIIIFFFCPIPLLQECPQDHGHKEDLRVAPKTCGSMYKETQVSLVWMSAIEHLEMPCIHRE